jgi:hypothetical protein
MSMHARFAVLSLVAFSPVAFAASPDALVARVQAAMDKGDVDAFEKEIEGIAGAPAMLRYVTLDMPNKCAKLKCTISAAPYTPEVEAKITGGFARQHIEFAQKPEGVLQLEGASADGSQKVKGSMPWATVNGQARLITGRYDAAHLATLKATTAEAKADELMASGAVSVAGQSEPEFKSKATALPADGGEPGAAFLARVRAMGAAVKSNDVDAAAAALGDFGKLILGANDYDGKPRTPAERQGKFRAQATRFTVEATVKGGYQLGDTAVIVFEGRNGAGNIVRGGSVMEKVGGRWEGASDLTVEIPGG